MPVPLLSTKLYVPRLRPNAIARPHLTEELLAGVNSPGSLTLLSGPAGFGKTTLLSEFIAQLPQPAAWLSLDEGDNDPIRFWTYLVAACQSAWSGVGETAQALLHSPQPLPEDAIPTLLINDLASQEGHLVLVLDDYHAIQNQTIHTAFSFLLEHLPGNLHPVVATRVDPPWPLARFRARNHLVEIRAADLRFSTSEAAAFLNQVMGLDLPAEQVAALEARTEGWIAGLQLAALSMKGRSDIAGFVKAFAGSNVYIAEYLVEEVLARLPEEVQAFLLKTSILDRLSAGLCDAVIGEKGKGEKGPEVGRSFPIPLSPIPLNESQKILEHLERSNIFLIPLDGEGQWYRYHHLFADLLQARLRQTLPVEAIAGLHRRAADWYERVGMVPEAVENALAGADYLHGVRLLEKVALPMILQAYVRTVEGWLQAIPQENLEQSPRLTMAFAWLNLLRGAISEAAPYLKRLEMLFPSPETGDEDLSLQGEWLVLQSELLNRQGKPAESRDLANRALQILPETDDHVRSMALLNLATAYQQMLDYEHAIETFQMIVRYAQAVGNQVVEILGISAQARMALQQGRLQRAFDIAGEGINRMVRSGEITPFSATLYGELGQIYYFWHQLEQAQRYLQLSIQSSGQSGYSDPEIYMYLLLSRMFQMVGNWDAAEREMQKASELTRRIPPAMIRENVISQQVRVDLAFGRLAAAQALLQADGFYFDGEFVFPEIVPGSNITFQAGLLYNSALRVLLFQARAKHNLVNLKRGIEIAGLVFAGELQCHHIPIALETLLLRAQIYAALGDNRNSLADVAQALELAEPEGFISPFVEEGEPARLLIADCKLRIDKTGQERLGSFIDQLLEAFPRKEIPGDRNRQISKQKSEISNLIEPLTSRELEVLLLLAAGCSNRTIAERLVITVSAVKKHTANIYGKMGVNSRTQAVACARQLGLLSAEE